MKANTILFIVIVVILFVGISIQYEKIVELKGSIIEYDSVVTKLSAVVERKQYEVRVADNTAYQYSVKFDECSRTLYEYSRTLEEYENLILLYKKEIANPNAVFTTFDDVVATGCNFWVYIQPDGRHFFMHRSDCNSRKTHKQ